MEKIKLFLKSTRIASRILFVLWLLFAIFAEFYDQSKFQTVLQTGVVFLYPIIMIEIRKNDAFTNYNNMVLKSIRTTKVVSRILCYFWLVVVVLSNFDISVFIVFSILLLLPTIVIEHLTNPILKKYKQEEISDNMAFEKQFNIKT